MDGGPGEGMCDPFLGDGNVAQVDWGKWVGQEEGAKLESLDSGEPQMPSWGIDILFVGQWGTMEHSLAYMDWEWVLE